MRRPVNSPYTITTEFGVPDSYAKFGRHSGIDYAVPLNRPVYAPVSGQLQNIVSPTGGNMVVIYDGQFWHRLMHNNAFSRNNGAVSEGEQVALAGTTGLSTGVHSHWDINREGVYPTSFNSFASPADWLAGKYQATQGGDMPIPDADNYYWRYGQKLAEQVRGRQLSRAEFSQHIAGKTDLRAVEILSDDPEADRALEAQRLGQLAQRDNWQGQIYGLQAQVAELGKRPTQEQLDALNKQVGDLTTSVQQAHDEVEKTKAELEEAKKNQDGFTQTDRDNQNKILGMVQSIFDYFKGQYRSFQKYIKRDS